EAGMLEGGAPDEAVAGPVLDVMIRVVEAREAEALQRAAERQRAQGAANLERLLVVRLRAAVRVAVVHADVDVAVVAREVQVSGEAEVGGGEEALALGEDLALEAVAVDAFHEVDVGRLLHAEARPRP